MRREVKQKLTEGPIGTIWSQTKRQTSSRERIAVFVAIPFVLVSISALPQHIQESWMLYVNSPTLEDAYLTNFVHGSVVHLGNNILAYIFLMSVLLPLAVFADWKQELYITMLFFLTAVPLVVSYYSVWTLQGTGVETTVGFSGVVAAFLGLHPIILFAFFKRAVSSNIRVHYGLALVAPELAVIFYSWSGISVSVIALSILSVLGLGLVLHESCGDWELLLSSRTNVLLVFTTIIVFSVVSYRILVGVGPNVNVYGHFIGFVSGFLFPGFLSLVSGLPEQMARVQERLRGIF
ncbi:hypothetical protein [Haloplanus halobius]|uniref:hypothetical protein n=1 Tax=Haloplanus halobius TaxID=2934938 RepID=UPI00200CC13C|nr:hypothetical protein [Haloplanus sp. XH21]